MLEKKRNTSKKKYNIKKKKKKRERENLVNPTPIAGSFSRSIYLNCIFVDRIPNEGLE